MNLRYTPYKCFNIKKKQLDHPTLPEKEKSLIYSTQNLRLDGNQKLYVKLAPGLALELLQIENKISLKIRL